MVWTAPEVPEVAEIGIGGVEFVVELFELFGRGGVVFGEGCALGVCLEGLFPCLAII